jgi:hypothetical protein
MTAIEAGGPPQAPGGVLARLDHIVYAVPDLYEAVRDLERRLGVRATPGGQHPGRGTRNALIALGPSSYLEILGPDPDQPKPERPRWLGIDALTAPRIAAWAVKEDDLETLVADAARAGVRLGDVGRGSRRRPDGVVLSWRFTDPGIILGDGLVPFFIDWGTSPHPAATSEAHVTLVDLRAEHPDPESVRRMLRALGLALGVWKGSAPALIATLDSPRGRVELK